MAIVKVKSLKRIRQGATVYLEEDGYATATKPSKPRPAVGIALHDSLGGYNGEWITEIMKSNFTRGYNSFSGIELKSFIKQYTGSVIRFRRCNPSVPPAPTTSDPMTVQPVVKPPCSLFYWDYKYGSEPEDDHEGMVYNAYNDAWYWL